METATRLGIKAADTGFGMPDTDDEGDFDNHYDLENGNMVHRPDREAGRMNWNINELPIL